MRTRETHIDLPRHVNDHYAHVLAQAGARGLPHQHHHALSRRGAHGGGTGHARRGDGSGDADRLAQRPMGRAGDLGGRRPAGGEVKFRQLWQPGDEALAAMTRCPQFGRAET